MPPRPNSVDTAAVRGRDKRAQVMDAAVELFLANGFDQTSMDAVAARAGVSKTTVYAHYADKLELFRAVIERAGAQFDFNLDRTRLDSRSDPETKLTQVIIEVLEATTTPAYLAFLRMVVTESARRPELTHVMEDVAPSDLITLVAAILQEEAALQGYTLPQPETHAVLLVRMVASCLQLEKLLVDSFRPGPALLEAHARWVTAIFLRGIRPRETNEQAAASPPPEGYSYPWVPDLYRSQP